MPPSLKTKLQSGAPLFGTLVTLPSLETAEILAEAGYDWLFVDLEHSPMDPSHAQAVLQAVAGRVPCLVRVALNDEIWIKKVLDTGAAGIIVPQVNTAEAAERVVRFSKYPPQGARSAGVSRAHGFGAHLQEYLDQANRETVVVVQIEHAQAVENIDAILAVAGLDALFVGPYDLSASMGRMGQVESPEVQAAITRVRLACQARGMPLGIFSAAAARAKAYAAEGYRLVAAGSDTLMLVQSTREMLSLLRG
jgi:2-dehydro-3-deoxyglucarate aldolase/4-hydroxy-2-oxoheptanedioate aldolase